MSILSEVSRQPRGADWLWHPRVVALYKLVLQNSDSNATGREAAVGALQNITAGETRVSPDTSQATVFLRLAANDTCVIVAPLSKWASVLSGVMLEQERMLPILLDLLDTNSDMVLRPLTGLLRNIARHCSNKDHMGRWPSSSVFVPGWTNPQLSSAEQKDRHPCSLSWQLLM